MMDDLNNTFGERNSALSIIIPVFNEEAVFPELLSRLQGTLPQLPKPTEIIFINDGSCDNTRQCIENICRSDSRFLGVHLSRNFGHQHAVSAGLCAASGEVVAILDGDLQDPPEMLPELFAKMKDEFDIVYGIRRERKEGYVKRACYSLFYKVLSRLAPIEIPLDSGDFCMMQRRVVEQLNSMPERHRFIRGMRSYLGFKQIGFPYDRDARAAGRSKYSWKKLMGLAADGIFSFSALPLRAVSFLGFVIAGLSILYALYVFIWKIYSHDVSQLDGFAAIAIGIFFLGGVQLICIGILGEYVGRIHDEVKQRPSFIVDSVSMKGDS
jgi:glycosyltransferase involved in cell wall biosynthesis